jgi:hypothetical protein
MEDELTSLMHDAQVTYVLVVAQDCTSNQLHAQDIIEAQKGGEGLDPDPDPSPSPQSLLNPRLRHV